MPPAVSCARVNASAGRTAGGNPKTGTGIRQRTEGAGVAPTDLTPFPWTVRSAEIHCHGKGVVSLPPARVEPAGGRVRGRLGRAALPQLGSADQAAQSAVGRGRPAADVVPAAAQRHLPGSARRLRRREDNYLGLSSADGGLFVDMLDVGGQAELAVLVAGRVRRIEGTLVPTVNWRHRSDLRSGKHRRYGVNVQLLVDLHGRLIGAS